MAVELKNHNIAYFPMPKTACTSLKLLCFEINEGRKFEKYKKDGKLHHIHNAGYTTPAFWDVNHKDLEDMTRIAVIRDPIARLLSAYSNRVGFHQELSERHIDMELAQKLGVGPDPSPDEFFLNLEKYRFLSYSIRHHTNLSTTFLGPDLGYFHQVFRIEELDRLTAFLSEAVSMELTLGREQTGGKKIRLGDLSGKARRQLTMYCLPDYALIKDYYEVPSVAGAKFPVRAAA